MVPSDLYTYSFALSGGVQQGTVVDQSDFPGVSCAASGTTASSTCKGSCAFDLTADPTAFESIVGRMNEIYAGIGADNVQIDYDWSGLGYSGDPNGSDVDPLVTVRVTDLSFRPIFLASIFDLGLPDLSYTLTMEDGQGDWSN